MKLLQICFFASLPRAEKNRNAHRWVGKGNGMSGMVEHLLAHLKPVRVSSRDPTAAIDRWTITTFLVFKTMTRVCVIS